MKLSFLLAFCLLLLTACSTTQKPFSNLKAEDCSQFIFGRIESRRQLTEEDKKVLLEKGLRIQEVILDNFYLGSWNQKWAQTDLDKTNIRSLNPFGFQDKLASGLNVTDLKKLVESPGKSIILLQTITTVDSTEWSAFGELIFHKDYFYRLVVPHQNLMDLIQYPCLRMMSIVKENYEPDDQSFNPKK